MLTYYEMLHFPSDAMNNLISQSSSWHNRDTLLLHVRIGGLEAPQLLVTCIEKPASSGLPTRLLETPARASQPSFQDTQCSPAATFVSYLNQPPCNWRDSVLAGLEGSLCAQGQILTLLSCRADVVLLLQFLAGLILPGIRTCYDRVSKNVLCKSMASFNASLSSCRRPLIDDLSSSAI